MLILGPFGYDFRRNPHGFQTRSTSASLQSWLNIPGHSASKYKNKATTVVEMQRCTLVISIDSVLQDKRNGRKRKCQSSQSVRSSNSATHKSRALLGLTGVDGSPLYRRPPKPNRPSGPQIGPNRSQRLLKGSYGSPTVEARELEYAHPPYPQPRKKENQHKTSQIHIPTFWSLL